MEVFYIWLHSTLKPVFDFLGFIWNAIPTPIAIMVGLFWGFAIGLAIIRRFIT